MKHPQRCLAIAILVVAAAGSLAAADAPYIGKWKLNISKSQLAGDTFTVTNLPNGMMHFVSQGFEYDFKADGKEYPDPAGGVVVWTSPSPNKWHVDVKLNGKVTTTYTLALSGNTIMLNFSMKKADGGSSDGSETYTRVSGTSGLAGKWKGSDVKAPLSVLEISANGADGLTWKDDTGFVCNAKFDGKDYPAGGTMAGSKSTYSIRKTGAQSFEISMKIDGKPFYTDAYTVSADGKTLTDVGTPLNAKSEAVKAVFDRQ